MTPSPTRYAREMSELLRVIHDTVGCLTIRLAVCLVDADGRIVDSPPTLALFQAKDKCLMLLEEVRIVAPRPCVVTMVGLWSERGERLGHLDMSRTRYVLATGDTVVLYVDDQAEIVELT